MSVYIVFGVSGSGKSTVGKLLAEKLGLIHIDADDYHPQRNIDKMRRGEPLDDEDRLPWLQKLANEINAWSHNEGAVLSCSALKEKYRELLGSKSADVKWIYLDGNRELVRKRLEGRKGHFFDINLLDAQFKDLEVPEYACRVPIDNPPSEIIDIIIKKLNMNKSEFGLVGLGLMGRSLAINLADKGVILSVYNRQISGKEEDIAKSFVGENAGKKISAYNDLQAFAASLQRPRTILIMVTAGTAVDSVIEDLLPHLAQNDMIMDGGNSHYEDTARRVNLSAKRGLLYLGAGISGGEEGARRGCSITAGGSRAAYDRAVKYLEMLAARDPSGKACYVYCGPDGAGHYVKMLHNGIEYAEIQLIAEVFFLLRRNRGFGNLDIADLFESWRQNGVDSYLLKITVDILRKKEGKDFLVDKILDTAGQKGTGAWSAITALKLAVPLDTIVAAVMARYVSGNKNERVKAERAYQIRYKKIDERDLSVESLMNAYLAARVINHAIGFDLIQKASLHYNWSLDPSEIARAWTAGCVIRSDLMNELVEIVKNTQNQNLLLNDKIVDHMKVIHTDLSTVVSIGITSGCAVPMMSAAANYFYGFTSGQSPANLVQAMRDYFGAHGYHRIDAPSDQLFHTDWIKSRKEQE